MITEMKAKDTVIPLEYSVLDTFHCKGIHDNKILRALHAQAEISFKAGYVEGNKDTSDIAVEG